MKRHFVTATLATLLLASCSPSSQKKSAEISQIENDLRESSQKNIADTAKVRQLMGDYLSYSNTFPDDSMTPVYLMKLAKFYDAMHSADSALVLYDKVFKSYPKYPKVNVALFSEAFIYNNEKHDLKRAEVLYKIYLDKYPNTSLAPSAKMEIHNLGKTPEQIMAEMDSIRKASTDSSTIAKK